MGWLTSTPVGYPFVMTRPTLHAIAGTISPTIGSSSASKNNVAVSCPSNKPPETIRISKSMNCAYPVKTHTRYI
jgi:hypothetical protein